MSVDEDTSAVETISQPERSISVKDNSALPSRSIPARSVVPTIEFREVKIGDTVTFKYVDELMPRHVKIVPLNQPCDRASGIIWPKDPLALALLGSGVGDVPEVSLPTGRREAEILEIQ